MEQEQLPVRVTEIGEFIRHHSCERRFKLEFNNRQLAGGVPFYSRFFNPIDPVLQQAGRLKENEWEETLKHAGLIDLTQYVENTDEDRSTAWDDFVEMLGELSVGMNAYGREIRVGTNLGAFHITGQIDFLLVLWDGDKPRLRVVECKASRRDRTYHRVQVTLYRMILRDLLQNSSITISDIPLTINSIECVVARIDESTNEIQKILDLESLGDLEREMADIQRLLISGGMLTRIVESDLSNLPYHLDMKCDGCVFNVHCLPDSAIGRRLELLGIEPAVVRALQSTGVSTIDDLAELDLAGGQASEIRADPGFTVSLDSIHQKARARRTTLPGGDTDPDAYQVELLPHWVQGQLPKHEFNGQRLVRVYLSVDYDYVENRVAALTAHVTVSDGNIYTDFYQIPGGAWRPDPEIKEQWEVGRDENERPVYQTRPVRGKDVVSIVGSPWSGQYAVDTGMERQLVQGFLHALVEAIAEVAKADEAPIHFYVWSRTEMTRLVEACSRVGSRLLSHLRQLLGCRESLEQLIFSGVQQEVNQRYALGWTGRGLSVVASLRWFGRRYHWTRRIHNAVVALDQVFTQDIFDFKTDLDLKADGTWAANPSEAEYRHKFEIRSRFGDSLTAPYLRAYWRELPDPASPGLDARVSSAIRRYKVAEMPGYLSAYLVARVHALRWIEERIPFKNEEIEKPLMNIAELQDFTLGVENTARAAIDFLRLDQHVSSTNWIGEHLDPPINRVPFGQTVPVKDVVRLDNGSLHATIDPEPFNTDLATLSAGCTIGDGSWIRLSPYSGDPHRGQTVRQLTRGGLTCLVHAIDWQNGEVTLGPLYMPPSRYVLCSYVRSDAGMVFDYATLDENISDFVSGHVEDRLLSGQGSHVYDWLDPTRPQIPEQTPISEGQRTDLMEFLQSFMMPSGHTLVTEQIRSAVDGLEARIQLLQGPPGTGKTATTAAAVLLRILTRRNVGDIILLAANTHTALDTLLQRIAGLVNRFQGHASQCGLSMPPIQLAKVHSSTQQVITEDGITHFGHRPCVTLVNELRSGSVLVIGGTTSALLKMARELGQRSSFTRHFPQGLQAPLLVVDEASMMVFPHFLALATLTAPNGEMMLSGDHRQLAPIVAHDWEREDRPPVILYQPYVSAYQAIRNIAQNHPGMSVHAIRLSALEFTFRLPPAIRELLQRLYRLDDIQLDGLPDVVHEPLDEPSGSWEYIWHGETGLYLVLHTERQSRRCNHLEAQIIQEIIYAGGDLPDGEIAVVAPYRAQRTMLQTLLEPFEGPVDMIDTVERLQGGERPTIIVSATASDPAAISNNVEFILNLNRSNVAFSRAQNRLIVVCSEELINHIPAEVDQYDSTMLWKSLRGLCSELVATIELSGHIVQILTLPIAATCSSG